MFCDFHTHLDQYKAGAERTEAERLIAENSILTVAASVSIPSWNSTLAAARRINFPVRLVIPTFGIHPSYCADLPQNEGALAALLEPYMAASPLIGEIGLDFYWEKTVPHATQERVFRCLLDHCSRTQKYCVIHTKGAEARTAAILADFPGARPVIHWYDGPEDVYRVFVERGYMQTFGCEVRYSEHIRTLLAMTPDSLLLSETDNPTGEPWLGGTDSSPLLIRRVVSDMAAVKHTDAAEMEQRIQKNTERLLGGAVFSTARTAPF